MESIESAKPIDKFDGLYAFLSNFYPQSLVYKGKKYRSAEHAYQAAKTTNRADRERIRRAATPGQAKRLGRTITIRPDWNSIRFSVMLNIVTAKFADKRLRRLLLATDPRELIEGNYWHDYYWGVCNGKGENNLGKILMLVRASHMTRKRRQNANTRRSGALPRVLH